MDDSTKAQYALYGTTIALLFIGQLIGEIILCVVFIQTCVKQAKTEMKKLRFWKKLILLSLCFIILLIAQCCEVSLLIYIFVDSPEAVTTFYGLFVVTNYLATCFVALALLYVCNIINTILQTSKFVTAKITCTTNALLVILAILVVGITLCNCIIVIIHDFVFYDVGRVGNLVINILFLLICQIFCYCLYFFISLLLFGLTISLFKQSPALNMKILVFLSVLMISSLIQVFSSTLFQFASLSPWIVFGTIICARLSEICFVVGVIVLYSPLTAEQFSQKLNQAAQQMGQFTHRTIHAIQNLDRSIMKKKENTSSITVEEISTPGTPSETLLPQQSVDFISTSKSVDSQSILELSSIQPITTVIIQQHSCEQQQVFDT